MTGDGNVRTPFFASFVWPISAVAQWTSQTQQVSSEFHFGTFAELRSWSTRIATIRAGYDGSAVTMWAPPGHIFFNYFVTERIYNILPQRPPVSMRFMCISILLHDGMRRREAVWREICRGELTCKRDAFTIIQHYDPRYDVLPSSDIG